MAQLIAARVETGPAGEPGIAWLATGKQSLDDASHHRATIRRLARARTSAQHTSDRPYGRVYSRRGRRSFLLIDVILPGRDDLGRPLSGAFLIEGAPNDHEATRLGAQIANLIAPLHIELDPVTIADDIRDAATTLVPDQGRHIWVAQLMRFLEGLLKRKDDTLNTRQHAAPAPAGLEPRLTRISPPPEVVDSASNENLPNRLVVLSRRHFDRLSYSRDARLLFDHAITVIPCPLEVGMEYSPAVTRLAAENRLVPGTMMVRNPWSDGDYVRVDTVYESFGIAKYRAIADVCQALGARRLTASRLEVQGKQQDESMTFQLDGGVQVVGADVQVDATSKQLAELSASLLQRYEWEGGQPDPEAAKEAARRARLLGNETVRTLIEQRSVGANQLRDYELTVDISSEATEEIAAAAKFSASLKASTIKVQLGGNLETLTGITRKLTVNLSVQF